MPSPFPGMDPYLEGELWSNFHTQFAVRLAQQLNPLLAPRYVAVTERYQNAAGPEEVAIATDAEVFAPDVGVSKVRSEPMKGGSAVALAVPIKMETVISIPVNHVWIKVLDVRRRLLVAAIEFLSPTNKHGKGRLRYLKKRRRLLLSDVHLMEIDLLRKGKRVPMVDPLPAAPYFVFLSRVERRPEIEVWPIRLDEPLPTVPVPLLRGDPDQGLNLQEAFQAVYDMGSMRQLIDYTQPPDVPLAADWAAWAESRLSEGIVDL